MAVACEHDQLEAPKREFCGDLGYASRSAIANQRGHTRTKGETMGKKHDKLLLAVIAWILFLGGALGFAIGLHGLIVGIPQPADFGVRRIGTGLWLLFSAVTIYLRNRI